MRRLRAILLTVLSMLLLLAGCAKEQSTTVVSVVDEPNSYTLLSQEKEKIEVELQEANAKIIQLTAELDELKNGAAQTIIKIRNCYTEGQEDEVISLAKYLNEKFTGSAEDIEAQDYVNKVTANREQALKDKEEAERLAKEEANKTAQEKARSIIKITKLSKSSPNFAGGVDLYINFINESDKVIKYITFNVEAINRVGDPAKCEITGRSVVHAHDEGPYKKGEGISGTRWLWEAVWYNWNIDKLILRSIEIEYMDGSKTNIDGKPFDYEW